MFRYDGISLKFISYPFPWNEMKLHVLRDAPIRAPYVNSYLCLFLCVRCGCAIRCEYVASEVQSFNQFPDFESKAA